MKLPDGWCEAPLEQLAESSLGKMLDKGKRTSGTPLPYLRNINVRWGEVDLTELYEMPFEDRELERYGLRQGDVLICEGGEPGRCAVWSGSDKRIMYQKAIHRVRPHRAVLDGQYLQLHIRDSAVTQELDALFTGTTIKHLTGTSLAKYVLRLPPLNEQRRIVDKIEALTARSRRAKEALDAVPALLDKLRQSILAAAFRGDLTKEWRAAHPNVEPASVLVDRARDTMGAARSTGRAATVNWIEGRAALSVGDVGPEPPEGWVRVPLTDIARLESGHTPSRQHPEWWNGDIPWIGIKDAREHHGGTILETTQSTNELGLANSAARLLPANTVCLSRTASVGYAVIMGRPMATSQDFVNWVCSPALLPEFLLFALLAEGEHLLKFGKGTTHTTIYFPEVKSFHLTLPSLAEQELIVSKVRAQLAKVEQLAASTAPTREELAAMDSAILAKAFRGELVPQDPTDEPASALLERIRAERESAVTTSPTKKTRAKRAAKASKSASR